MACVFQIIPRTLVRQTVGQLSRLENRQPLSSEGTEVEGYTGNVSLGEAAPRWPARVYEVWVGPPAGARGLSSNPIFTLLVDP